MIKELEINCIHDNNLSCLERPIATVLNWQGVDYRYIFSSCWTFSYNYMEHYNGIQNVPELMSFLENSEKYTGISFNIQMPSSDKRIQIISDEIANNRPVIVYINSYWCPWFPSYKRSHIHHYILVIGINTEDHYFTCLDKLDTQKKVILPFDDYNNGAGELALVRFSQYFNYKAVRKLLIVNAINSLAPNATKLCIHEFADQIRTNINMDEQLKNYHDARVAPIYTWLKGIADDRLNYAGFLKLILTDCNDYCLKLADLSSDWRSVIILLIKAGNKCSNESAYEIIAQRIDRLAEAEYSTMNELRERLKHG